MCSVQHMEKRPQHAFMIKVLERTDLKGTQLNITKAPANGARKAKCAHKRMKLEPHISLCTEINSKCKDLTVKPQIARRKNSEQP